MRTSPARWASAAMPLLRGAPRYKAEGLQMLAAIELLTGRRVAQVHGHRTKKEYAHFMRDVAGEFPGAEKIRLVRDNPNTHNASSFYERFPADEAFALSQRFEYYYTPKSASWLNMVEIEFSALSRQCLNRRIPTMEELTDEILAIVKERMEKRVKITWQFSIEAATKKKSAGLPTPNSNRIGQKDLWLIN